jgi:hypothetical protein
MDTTTLARAARHIADVIGEYHHAGRRMTALIMTPGRRTAAAAGETSVLRSARSITGLGALGAWPCPGRRDP